MNRAGILMHSLAVGIERLAQEGAASGTRLPILLNLADGVSENHSLRCGESGFELPVVSIYSGQPWCTTIYRSRLGSFRLLHHYVVTISRLHVTMLPIANFPDSLTDHSIGFAIQNPESPCPRLLLWQCTTRATSTRSLSPFAGTPIGPQTRCSVP